MKVVFLLSLVLGLSAALPAAARQQVAFVLHLRGTWVRNSSQELSPGTPLSAGDIIKAREPRGGDYIVIADRSGNIVINSNCDDGGCDRPIKVAAIRPGVTSRIFQAAMALLANDPRRFVVAISRGGEFREAVVKLDGQRVDLTPVLAGNSGGTYLLRFEPGGADGRASAKRIRSVAVAWEPDKPAVVTVKGLRPGLYVVQQLSRQDHEPLEPGSEALVLLAKPGRFQEASGEFREALALTDSWGESVRRNAKRQFLRACLGSLDSEAR